MLCVTQLIHEVLKSTCRTLSQQVTKRNSRSFHRTAYHNKENVPYEESRSPTGFACCRQGRVFVLGVLKHFSRDLFPRFHVIVQAPLLLIDKGLDVDATDVAVIFFQVNFKLTPLGAHCDRQVLWN